MFLKRSAVVHRSFPVSFPRNPALFMKNSSSEAESVSSEQLISERVSSGRSSKGCWLSSSEDDDGVLRTVCFCIL